MSWCGKVQGGLNDLKLTSNFGWVCGWWILALLHFYVRLPFAVGKMEMCKIWLGWRWLGCYLSALSVHVVRQRVSANGFGLSGWAGLRSTELSTCYKLIKENWTYKFTLKTRLALSPCYQMPFFQWLPSTYLIQRNVRPKTVRSIASSFYFLLRWIVWLQKIKCACNLGWKSNAKLLSLSCH